jgi:hypothetical protein
MLPFESPCAYYEGRRDSSRSSDQALQTELGTSSFTPFRSGPRTTLKHWSLLSTQTPGRNPFRLPLTRVHKLRARRRRLREGGLLSVAWHHL